MKVVWICRVEDVSKIPPEKKGLLARIVERAKKSHGGFVSITIETPKKPRTTGDKSQSHHLNGHIQQIAEETGMPFEAVKLEVKHRGVSMGYPMLLKKNGEVKLDIWGRVMGISEADSSTKDCAILIEVTHILAAEIGMILKEGTNNGN